MDWRTATEARTLWDLAPEETRKPRRTLNPNPLTEYLRGKSQSANDELAVNEQRGHEELLEAVQSQRAQHPLRKEYTLNYNGGFMGLGLPLSISLCQYVPYPKPKP